jgi:hypothetical protein
MLLPVLGKHVHIWRLRLVTFDLQAPWYPYQLLLDRAILLHALSTFVAFGAMFSCVVELSWFLAAAPYYLTPAMIGIACLAQNAAGENAATYIC